MTKQKAKLGLPSCSVGSVLHERNEEKWFRITTLTFTFRSTFSIVHNCVCSISSLIPLFDALSRSQEGRLCVDNILKGIFLTGKTYLDSNLTFFILFLKIKFAVNVQVVAWCRANDKSLSEWIMTQFTVAFRHHYFYRQSSNIRHIKSYILNVSRLVFQLSLPNPLKPDVQSGMKM